MLYVLGMKINLVSILALEGKGYKVAFSDGKVLAWHTNSRIDMGEESLYRLNTLPIQALVHEFVSMGDLWH